MNTLVVAEVSDTTRQSDLTTRTALDARAGLSELGAPGMESGAGSSFIACLPRIGTGKFASM